MKFFLRFLLVIVPDLVLGISYQIPTEHRILANIIGECSKVLTGQFDKHEKTIQALMSFFPDDEGALEEVHHRFKEWGIPQHYFPNKGAPKVLEKALQALRLAGMDGFAQCIWMVEGGSLLWHVYTLLRSLQEMNKVGTQVETLRDLVEAIIEDYFKDDETLDQMYDSASGPEMRKKCKRDLLRAEKQAKIVRTYHETAWLLCASGAAVGTVTSFLSFGLAALPTWVAVQKVLVFFGVVQAGMTSWDWYNLTRLWDAFAVLESYEKFLAAAKRIIKKGKLTKADRKLLQKVTDNAKTWLQKTGRGDYADDVKFAD